MNLKINNRCFTSSMDETRCKIALLYRIDEILRTGVQARIQCDIENSIEELEVELVYLRYKALEHERKSYREIVNVAKQNSVNIDKEWDEMLNCGGRSTKMRNALSEEKEKLEKCSELISENPDLLDEIRPIKLMLIMSDAMAMAYENPKHNV